MEHDLSIILISHALGAVRSLADRVYVMYAGTVVESSMTESFFAEPRHPYAQALLKAVPRLSGGGIAEGIPGRLPDYLNPPSGCRFHPRCEYAWDLCRAERPSLYAVDTAHKAACFLFRSQQ